MPKSDFKSYPIPRNEEARLAFLNKTGLLYAKEEPIFNRVIRLASTHFDVPVVLVTVIGKDKQFIKAKRGTDYIEMPREDAFCAHAIINNSNMVILDARKDERFKDNPMVSGSDNILFYAGAPIILDDQIIIGTVCLIDTKAHTEFSKTDEMMLRDLASLTADTILLNYQNQD